MHNKKDMASLHFGPVDSDSDSDSDIFRGSAVSILETLALHEDVKLRSLLKNVEFTYYDNGTVSSERWLKRGKIHRLSRGIRWRDSGPTLHRKFYPAFVTYREDGSASEIRYYTDGKLHRSNGPAILEAGKEKEWWVNGKYIDHTRRPMSTYPDKYAEKHEGMLTWWIEGYIVLEPKHR